MELKAIIAHIFEELKERGEPQGSLFSAGDKPFLTYADAKKHTQTLQDKTVLQWFQNDNNENECVSVVAYELAKDAYCPYCKVPMEALTSMEDARNKKYVAMPFVGGINICMYCRQLSTFYEKNNKLYAEMITYERLMDFLKHKAKDYVVAAMASRQVQLKNYIKAKKN